MYIIIEFPGKKWVLWMELASNDKCANIIDQRKRQGFRYIEKVIKNIYYIFALLQNIRILSCYIISICNIIYTMTFVI